MRVGLGLPLITDRHVLRSFIQRQPLLESPARQRLGCDRCRPQTIFLHTTNLFSGFLLITLGIALAMGYLTYLNSLIPIELQIWFSDFEEKVLHWFM